MNAGKSSSKGEKLPNYKQKEQYMAMIRIPETLCLWHKRLLRTLAAEMNRVRQVYLPKLKFLKH